MRAAFHPAGNHHRVRARQPAHRVAVRQFAEPAIARAVLGRSVSCRCRMQRARLGAERLVHRATELHHAHRRAGRQVRQRIRRAQRVFLIPQMADHGDEKIGGRRCLPLHRVHRLVNHPRLCAQGRSEFVQAFGLQHDHCVGQLHRPLGAGAGANVAIQVGAGERKNQRPAGFRFPPLDGRCAAPCMQCNHQVVRLPGLIYIDDDFRRVAGRAQVARPAHRRVAVAVARAGFGGSDD